MSTTHSPQVGALGRLHPLTFTAYVATWVVPLFRPQPLPRSHTKLHFQAKNFLIPLKVIKELNTLLLILLWPGNTKGGSITVPLTSCLTGLESADNFCFYLQNRIIQTSQTGGQWYSDTSTFSIPCFDYYYPKNKCFQNFTLILIFPKDSNTAFKGWILNGAFWV